MLRMLHIFSALLQSQSGVEMSSPIVYNHQPPEYYSLCSLNPNAFSLDHECVRGMKCQSTKETTKSSSATRMYVRASTTTRKNQSYSSRSFPFPFNPDPSVSILNLGVPAGLASLPSPWKNSHENLSALPDSFQTTTSSPE